MIISRNTSILLLVIPLLAQSVNAQLAVKVSPAKVAGQKAVVPLTLVNGFAEGVESARAVVFLSDAEGKVVGQSTRWIIGGQAGPAPKTGLRPGTTNTFNFVVDSLRTLTATNLTANLKVIRLVLEGGKVADPVKDVVIQPAEQ
jgi:hypothetical protein